MMSDARPAGARRRVPAIRRRVHGHGDVRAVVRRRTRNYELHVPVTLPAGQVRCGAAPRRGRNGQHTNGLTASTSSGTRGLRHGVAERREPWWNDGRHDLKTTAVDEQVDDVGSSAR